MHLDKKLIALLTGCLALVGAVVAARSGANGAPALKGRKDNPLTAASSKTKK